MRTVPFESDTPPIDECREWHPVVCMSCDAVRTMHKTGRCAPCRQRAQDRVDRARGVHGTWPAAQRSVA